MSTIPASELVNVSPQVLAAGGAAKAMVGIMLTENTRVPINPVGSTLSLPTLLAVQNYFGAETTEAVQAGIYFKGFDNSNTKPNALLFAQYPAEAVGAYLRGGAFGLTLAQMQALSGSLTAIVDGYAHVITSISLASYNSFSAAAAGIAAAFTDPTEASFTAAIGSGFTASGSGTALTVSAVAYGVISVGDTITGVDIPADTTIVSGPSNGLTGVYVTSNATTASSASCAGLSTILNVSIDTDHSIAVGQTVVGSGVTGTPVITAQISGTPGGVGLYRISGAQQTIVPPESMTSIATPPTVTYDSVSGAFIIASGITGTASTSAFATGTLAAPLKLTSATGAVLSQGAAATTPAAFMAAVMNRNTNWATFMTLFDPDSGSGNTQKLAFAAWVNSLNNEQFAYACWDPDLNPGTEAPAVSSLGYLLKQANSTGTEVIHGVDISGDPDPTLASFFCGSTASIDWNQRNGRITFAYKGQTGIVPNVSDPTTANNLIANGYNFYGVYATAAQQFNLYQPGSISGPWTWADSYVNQIYFNAQFQVALLLYLSQVKSVPFNPAGYAGVAASVADVIQQGLTFGAWRAGVPLSSAQASEVNDAAGVRIDQILSTQGWYLQVVPSSPQVRQARGPLSINFWYMDGESVQTIELASVDVQ